MAQRRKPSDTRKHAATRAGAQGAGTKSTGTEASASAARLFDARRMIGGLFVIYGVLVTAAGILDGDGAKEKAQGIDINLWAGLGMLALGLFFLVWLRLSPTDPPQTDDQEVMREAARRAKH